MRGRDRLRAMPHPARFLPSLIGFVILCLMLFGSGGLSENLCRVARHPLWLSQHCLSQNHLALSASLAAIGLIALTLLLLLRWQRHRPRALSYESDAGRWVMLGWVLAIGGALSLLAGMLLIGSNGWPFSTPNRRFSAIRSTLARARACGANLSSSSIRTAWPGPIATTTSRLPSPIAGPGRLCRLRCLQNIAVSGASPLSGSTIPGQHGNRAIARCIFHTQRLPSPPAWPTCRSLIGSSYLAGFA